MDYEEAITHLLTLVDHERNRVRGPRQRAIYNLDRMEAFLDRLGQPHRKVPSVHIAGTKGKGSTAALCDSALRAAGYETGFYSSPHLHAFRERIRRDTLPVTEQIFAGLVEELWDLRDVGPEGGTPDVLTLFEFLTGMAFHCFERDRIGVQIIEVGLGGRLDATNVLDAGVCVITSISLDHTAVLGNTVAEIARDKAGIIKPGAAVVVSPQTPEALGPILEACEAVGSTPVLVGRDVTWEQGPDQPKGQSLVVHGRNGDYPLQLPLLGSHQLENAATAVAALEVLDDSHGLKVGADDLLNGFSRVSWPCRMEILSGQPLLVADGAHNVYSTDSLLASLPRYLHFQRLIVIAGISRDKDVAGMVRSLAGAADQVYATASRHPRAVPAPELAELFGASGIQANAAASPAAALEQATAAASPGDLLLATGSLFLAAEVREAALGIKPELYPKLPTSQ